MSGTSVLEGRIERFYLAVNSGKISQAPLSSEQVLHLAISDQ